MSDPVTDDNAARLILRAFAFAAGKYSTHKRKDAEEETTMAR